jgi:quinolinate synthase
VLSKPSDEKYWLDRARDAYAQADLMMHPEAKRLMVEIAAGYQRLAQLTEERTERHKKPSSR